MQQAEPAALGMMGMASRIEGQQSRLRRAGWVQPLPWLFWDPLAAVAL